jgi:hypothetical protein
MNFITMAGCIDDREFGMNKNWLGTGSGLEIKVMLMHALFYLQSRPKYVLLSPLSGWANYMSSRYRLRLTNGMLGRGKAVTNICKQGASAWVKHATVRMLQINNALIGYFPPISTASPISTTPFPPPVP